MKKIIHGKLYDTDTAKKVGYWSNGRGYRDFTYCEESLYRKRTGEFFLYGSGGPSSRYSQRIEQNTWSGGEDIIPMSAPAARDWAEEHLDADDYAEIFGMPDEGSDEKDTLCVQLPADVMAKLRAGASDAGKSLTAYTEMILRRGFSAHDDPMIYVVSRIQMTRPRSALDSIYGVRDLVETASDMERTEISRHSTKVQALKAATAQGIGSARFEGDRVIITATVINEMRIDTSGYTDPSDAALGDEVFVSAIAAK